MNDIKYKLKKYSTYRKGEAYRPEYEKKVKQEAKLKNRMLILDELIRETSDYFNITKTQKQTIQNLLVTLNSDFKRLHRQASEEAIILALVFQQEKLMKPRIQLENYTICRKYGLTEPIFILILCRVNEMLMKQKPPVIRESNTAYHDELMKAGNF